MISTAFNATGSAPGKKSSAWYGDATFRKKYLGGRIVSKACDKGSDVLTTEHLDSLIVVHFESRLSERFVQQNNNRLQAAKVDVARAEAAEARWTTMVNTTLELVFSALRFVERVLNLTPLG